MVPTFSRWRMPRAPLCLLCSVFLATQALAQPAPAPTVRRADPLDPKAPMPALQYQSALAQYRRLSDDKSVSWREANDTVTRIGGWRVYAREAQQPDPPVPPAAQPTSGMPADRTQKPMPAGHGGHKQP